MRFKPAEKLFKKALIGLFSAFLPDVLYSPDQVDLGSVKSILVLRQHDQLGETRTNYGTIKELNLICDVMQKELMPALEGK